MTWTVVVKYVESIFTYLVCTVIIDLFVSPLLADITAVCWLMVHFNLKFDICVVINVQKLIVFGQRYVSAGFFF